MNKRMHRSAAVACAVAAAGMTLAGPASAARPDAEGGGRGNASAQALRVRADLRDLREQTAAGPGSSRSGSDPAGLPLLPVGLGALTVAAFAAGVAGMRRRAHEMQPA